MSYSRQPNVLVAGRGLLQNPPPTTVHPPGVISVSLDVDIASTSTLGCVQVGSGLSITPTGVLSATGSGSSLVNVTLVSSNYTATANDDFIGATKKDIEITLPAGVTGKVYIIKNKASGSVTVKASASQKIDGASDKSLGSMSSLYVIFDGVTWNIIT